MTSGTKPGCTPQPEQAVAAALDEDLSRLDYSLCRHDPLIVDRACTALRSSLLKKSAYLRTAKCADVAIDDFIKSGHWCDDYVLSSHARSLAFYLQYLDHDSMFGVIPALGRLGPGASVGSQGVSLYNKLFAGGSFSTTDETLWRDLVSTYGSWPLMRDAIASSVTLGPRMVQGNSATTVAKNNVTDRVICTEPLANSFWQQGIGRWIEGRIKSHLGIDLATQPDWNRQAARRGSLDQSFATIDLSCASDTISSVLAKEVLPSSLYSLCDWSRSPYTKVRGTWIKHGAFSTMGNAFTFPLQTAIFSAVVQHVYDSLGIPFNRAGQPNSTWGVFGDDIIVVTKAYDATVRLLRECGFIPNEAKSFSRGVFRESCGTDWFFGTNIRGVYIKDSLRDQSSVNSAFNRLAIWSMNFRVPLVETLRVLRGLMEQNEVPEWEDETAGVRTRKRRGSYRALQPVVKKFATASFQRRNESGYVAARLFGGLSGPTDPHPLFGKPQVLSWQLRTVRLPHGLTWEDYHGYPHYDAAFWNRWIGA